MILVPPVLIPSRLMEKILGSWTTAVDLAAGVNQIKHVIVKDIHCGN
jgi:hypothetical protein